MRKNRLATGVALGVLIASGDAAFGQTSGTDGLLFRMSADSSLTADVAAGSAEPTFMDKVEAIPAGGVGGGYLKAEDEQILAWAAPGNIQAQRGTLSFFWRAREPLGRNEFPLFRVSYANHTSWDMVFLRIDWNGHGFDAFVTDVNLSRVRVSWEMPEVPAADAWTHVAFAWDETTGVSLFVNGKLAQRKDQPALLDASLDQFGPHSRIISPIQVQSRYNFLRGGDLDELQIYDHALGEAEVAALSRLETPVRERAQPDWLPTWTRRLGFEGAPPPYLDEAATHIRRVEFTDHRDVAERMWKGNDGIRETTWPGVYNRSRLTGRHDYFTLPDWDVYSTGGKSATWFLPAEPWNQIEVQGAAYGRLGVLHDATVPSGNGQVTAAGDLLARRVKGVERTTTRLGDAITGGAVRFVNDQQETPIEEIGAYYVAAGSAPAGIGTFETVIRSGVEPDYAATGELTDFIAGRYPVEERATVAALPAGAANGPRRTPAAGARPIVHVIIPQDLRTQAPGLPLNRGATFGYENFGGLDGVELTLPALDLPAGRGGFIPLNIRIKDPLTPTRDLMDVNISVKPGEARTLWLDTRDRILPPNRSLYFTVASSNPGFGVDSLDGARVRLVFKSREAARAEHETDRFEQIRDNYGFLVEERQSTRQLGLFARFYDDLTDLLRVNPNHPGAVAYWSEWNPQQPLPPVEIAAAPPGVPAWAWGQTQYLKQVADFVTWWIDNRQVDGEFGGGLSDDTDLMNQWPGLALMGSEPDKINASLSELIEAIYRNGMFTRGLGTIVTDELHVYEEGVNAVAQSSYLNPGDPLATERLMETAVNFSRLTEVNPQGHRLFVSNYFGGDKIVRENPWQWSKAYSYLILHPGIRLVDYNGSPELKRLLLELADGYLAHGTQGADGAWTYPAEINWPDGATRGAGGPAQTNLLMWAAWRWTGDTKYLAPIEQVLREGGLAALSGIVNSDLSLELDRPALREPLVRTAASGGDNPLALGTAWQATGDKRYLERLYDGQRKAATLRMPMMTEDQWWVDRVELPSQELQRQRLGGVALWRNAIVQGNRISWRFDQPRDAEKLAVLVREPTRTGFRIVAYNLSDQPLTATITGAEVATGDWRLTHGVDANGDDRAEAPETRSVSFGQGQSTTATFAPGVTTVLEFQLTGAEADIRSRPDAAIATRDLAWDRNRLTATVHNLGSQPTPAGRVVLESATGAELASAPLPGLAAPNDLVAKTVAVQLVAPNRASLAGSVVRIRLDGAPEEITLSNNTAVVPER